MAHLTASVEYGVHCLLWLAVADDGALSSREMAGLQGVSPAFVAKIFPKLEKAGIVAASNGLRGGYRLTRSAARISLLEIVDAIEGEKPLFECQEIRSRCALFEGRPPRWATQGVCAIHAAMLNAEQAMRESLAATTLADIARTVERKAPAAFDGDVRAWLGARNAARGTQRKPRRRAARTGDHA